MKINKNVKSQEVELEGASDVSMKILVGPDDGSEGIVMREFAVRPGGNTPYHTHDYEHVVKVVSGVGLVVDENGVEHEILEGMSLFVKPNEKHQFKNTGDDDFVFICVIPN